MSDNSETVREVCAEINTECDKASVEGYEFGAYDVINYVDRILSAHEREMAEKDAEIAQLKEELKKTVDDNSRMIAALKPVLYYNFGDYKTPWKTLNVDGELMKGCVRCGDGYPLSLVVDDIFGIDSFIEMANAIGETQRIMKEGV